MNEETVVCRDCGLEVRADNHGNPRKHLGLALRAGLKDAACVKKANARDRQHRQNVKDRRRWAKDLAERREREADRETTLPKHLR